MLKRYMIVGLSLIMAGCSLSSDPQIIVRAGPEKRPPKPEYMPGQEKPLKLPSEGGDIIPLTPQVGIRVPLEK